MSPALAEYASLCIALHVGVRDADEVAEHEIVVGAKAGRCAHNVPGGRFEVEAGKAIGLVADFRVPAHAPMSARQKLRIGEQARQGHDRICGEYLLSGARRLPQWRGGWMSRQ